MTTPLDHLKAITNRRKAIVHLKTLTAIKQAAQLTVDQYDAALDTDTPQDPVERRVYDKRYQEVFAQTGDDLAATQAAVGALRRYRLNMPVKALKSSSDYLVMGWGALYTDAKEKDTDNTYFARDTNFFLEDYQSAPLWLEHGYSPTYSVEKVGNRVDVLQYPFGLYAIHKLDTQHPLFEATAKACESRYYGYSLDSLKHYMELGYRDDGKLGTFPAAGWSLVHYPAEPGLGFVQLKRPEIT